MNSCSIWRAGWAIYNTATQRVTNRRKNAIAYLKLNHHYQNLCLNQHSINIEANIKIYNYGGEYVCSP